MTTAACHQCGAEFYYTQTKGRGKNAVPLPPPPVCGELHCRARQDWADDDWAGRARMALGRQAAGLELDDLDLDALARFPDPPRNRP